MNHKILFIYCCFLALVFSGTEVYSQRSRGKSKPKKEAKKNKLSKAEGKIWKNKLKVYRKDLKKFKTLVESEQQTKKELLSLAEEVEKSKSLIKEKEMTIAELKDQAVALQDRMKKMQTVSIQKKSNKASGKMKSEDFQKGIVFKVQIGSFKARDLNEYLRDNPHFGAEKTDSGGQNITIGIFRDYWIADKFKKELRAMGVRGAWVVPYKNGQRVKLNSIVKSLKRESS